ncbi:ectonucleoside triphosphate diphosphohydrolase 8 [Empidonax traillii]|uniref:ectonucleoside triphosphate diphosphohydrolase 8 n=1 Tax=Empidonax traillii TaxID=164674 RepID=UPI000FFCF702|nr:ectonucleoside triphosphate diphosphohydrolase 8 [Empidonax traillii]
MMANKKPFTSAIIGALVALSIIALVLSLVKVEDVTLPPTVKYGLVFDAGSSHTSLFVYEWDSDKENDTGVVSQTLSCDVQGPGISSYAHDPPKAGDSLRECLDKALTVVPAAKHRDVPAYLGATAGMRLLREQNSSAADQVLAEVTKTMQEYPVDFKGARILSGEEEGAYGWITINYLLDSFTKFSPKARAWLRPEAANVFGALDLGGASTQISFMPEGSVMDQNEASKFTLYGYSYNIYTHSYLCYGQNEALKRLAKELIAESAPSRRVQHPCYPKGYNETVHLSSFRTSPCTNRSDARLPLGDSTVTLEGRGSASGCRAALRELFNFSACGQSRDCTFDGVHQPPLRGQFIAFAGFYYTFNFLNLTTQKSLNDVNATILAFCKRNWSELEQTFPEAKKYLHTYCSVGIYILTLLLDGFKFSEHTWSNIHFSRQAANTDIGWTLGFMLNFTNMIPAEPLELVKGHQPGLWAGAVSFIVLALVTGLVAVLLLCFWKTK